MTEIKDAFDGFILSASGWRKIFAPSGNEEDTSADISPADKTLTAAAALVFADFLKNETPRPVCALGTDTRPTGPALASIIAAVLSARGVEVRSLAALPAPEIMAYVRKSGDVSAFFYVTASHNPVGHNGFKFGLADGGVLGGAKAAGLITAFRDACFNPALLSTARGLAGAVQGTQADPAEYRAAARRAYTALTREVAAGSSGKDEQAGFFTALRRGSGSIAALADFNGSARALSIDREILSEAGVDLYTMNDTPGRIAHRIVPEGESLLPCRERLEELHGADRRYIFGYVPDNDGDRGNLVYLDPADGQARAMEAQEVFSLAVLAELASLRFLHNASGTALPAAVAVNGPTSRRIEAIASLLGAEVFRCEVGEANVVELARQKREEGYNVRILGEGSNGGNITHPSSVRDPINTVFSLLKLLLLKDKPGLFKQWCRISGNTGLYRDDFSIRDILDSLPAYTTTSAYEEEAKIRIKTRDQAALKAAWEDVFLRDWEKKKDRFRSGRGVVSWKEVNYEGTGSSAGFGPAFRSGEQKGGLSMLLKDRDGEVKAFLWMRGSGTEPVFRVLVDVEGGDRAFHDELLTWHRSMVLEADARITRG